MKWRWGCDEVRQATGVVARSQGPTESVEAYTDQHSRLLQIWRPVPVRRKEPEPVDDDDVRGCSA